MQYTVTEYAKKAEISRTAVLKRIKCGNIKNKVLTSLGYLIYEEPYPENKLKKD